MPQTPDQPSSSRLPENHVPPVLDGTSSGPPAAPVRTRHLAIAACTAIVLAALAVVPAIGAVATWKILLAVLGLALLVIAGRDRSRR